MNKFTYINAIKDTVYNGFILGAVLFVAAGFNMKLIRLLGGISFNDFILFLILSVFVYSVICLVMVKRHYELIEQWGEENNKIIDNIIPIFSYRFGHHYKVNMLGGMRIFRFGWLYDNIQKLKG